ncbi:MAG: glycosyltransferase [Candidatus Bathyarchaeia archaeon]
MNAQSTLSVVIPTFQEERYIEKTLSSLSKIKAWAPLEIVVVDGGSTDHTVDKAKRFADKVYQLRKRGISRARNFGAKKASGDIILFLDADVDPTQDFVDKVLEIFNDSSVVGATCNIMPVHAKTVENVFFKLYNKLLRFVCRFKPHSRGEFLAVRKMAFLALKGFDEELPCLEDHEFAFRLSKVGKFVFADDFTVYESMRRFRKLGLHKVVGTWVIDYLSFLIRRKPLSAVWKPVR